MRKRRSQPTYEELKRSLPTICYGHGSQPTYEELKPRTGKSERCRQRVLSLPMRN